MHLHANLVHSTKPMWRSSPWPLTIILLCMIQNADSFGRIEDMHSLQSIDSNSSSRKSVTEEKSMQMGRITGDALICVNIQIRIFHRTVRYFIQRLQQKITFKSCNIWESLDVIHMNRKSFICPLLLSHIALTYMHFLVFLQFDFSFHHIRCHFSRIASYIYRCHIIRNGWTEEWGMELK